MMTNDNVQNPKSEKDIADNNNASPKDDTIGENAGSAAEKGKEPNVQDKPDGPRVTTVTPDNDSGDPGPSKEQPSSNKGQGPAGENL